MGWDNFLEQTQTDQARFLLDQASSAWEMPLEPADIRSQVREYLRLGYRVLDGDYDKLPQLLTSMQDDEMDQDFWAFYERVKDDDTPTRAALDLASYACGFTARVAAHASGYRPLPDPVWESVPDIYQEFREVAQTLGM